MIKEKKIKVLVRKALYLSPRWLQDSLSFFYLRYGLPLSVGLIKYQKARKFLNELQWWPRWKLEQYQTEKLKQLLHYVYNNVPYYTEIFKKLNLAPMDFQSIKDLRKLPILTKEDVIKNFDKLISLKINKKYLKSTWTSGSSGKPMQFYYDRDYEISELALFRILRDSRNLKVDDRYIHLWSRPFLERGIKEISLYEPHIRKLSLSTVPQSLNLFGEYLRLIKKFNPAFVQGNPSLLYHLACYAQEMNINNVKFKKFFSTLENLFPYQRHLIEKQFNCEIFNCYRCEERVTSAFECTAHKGMHIEMEEGIVEVIGENGEPSPEEHTGRLIATGLHNYAMPLIRYEIGDVGSISSERCPCGRYSQLLKSFDGRTNEVLKFRDKRVYSTTLSVLLWKFKNIKECQFIQDKENEIKVNIVKRKGYSKEDNQELIMTLKKIIDDKLNISIDFVDYIPRTKMGKFPFIVSNLNIANKNNS